MENIQKPLQIKNDGFILFESLVALFITALVVMVFLSQSAFILRSDKNVMQRIYLYRSLYEEAAAFSRGENRANTFQQDGFTYKFFQQDGVLVKAEIQGREETFIVERK